MIRLQSFTACLAPNGATVLVLSLVVLHTELVIDMTFHPQYSSCFDQTHKILIFKWRSLFLFWHSVMFFFFRSFFSTLSLGFHSYYSLISVHTVVTHNFGLSVVLFPRLLCVYIALSLQSCSVSLFLWMFGLFVLTTLTSRWRFHYFETVNHFVN